MPTASSISDLAAGLRALAERWSQDREIAAVYLHGSRARGNARPDSDIDLAAILQPSLTASERWNKRLALIDDASQEFRTDAIDLLILEESPSAVAHRVIRDGRLLVDRAPRRRVQVVEDALRRYLDEAWLRKTLDEGLRDRIAEGRFAR